MFRLAAITSLALALLLAGCATPEKKITLNDPGEMSKTGNPVFLLTITLRNIYSPLFQPKLMVVNVERSAVNGADKIDFTTGNMVKNESGSPVEGNSYLLRMELEPGEYVIRGLVSTSKFIPVVGHYFAPLNLYLKSDDQGVFYIGHIDATIRERRPGEFRAGPILPLVDQDISGAAYGTFDIEITDQWDKDEPKFLAQYPALSTISVRKNILPPFDRGKAQQWSKAN